MVYVNIPKPNLDYIITPAKRVHELNDQQLDEFIKEGYVSSELPGKLIQEFKSRNEKYIGLLAKEFEMRKAARAYNKSKISDTGDIDVGKLASYKFDDNIFRKMMVTPKGKSHGLVLLLDKSGSMRDNMAGSIEQILVLTMFCRKVNIPFVVYGFGSNDSVKRIDLGIKSGQTHIPEQSFTKNVNDLVVSDVYLREYLNSNMSNAEFTRAVKHMLVIKKSYERKKQNTWKTADNSYRFGFVPTYRTEELYNTPLTEALIATAEVIKDFKKKNNLDITNLVIVHDGDTDGTNRYWREDFGSKIGSRFNFTDSNFYLQDVKNNFVEKIDMKYESVYELVLNWFNKTTDSKIFGFFICDTGRKRDIKNAIGLRYYVDGVNVQSLEYKNFYLYDKTLKAKIKELKTEKFLESQSPGFKSFFLIAGGDDLNTDNEGLEVLGKVTKKSLVKAFTQLNKKKAVNRVLVSRFIQGIAV